jgi:hypothetical protein
MFEKIKEFVLGKKEQQRVEYPDSFILITYSAPAIEDGTEDDSNKIILFYIFNKFNRRIKKQYPYSDERLAMLQKTYRVPFFDKTERKLRFPVFAKINPGEAVYVE